MNFMCMFLIDEWRDIQCIYISAGHFQARLVYYLMNVHTQPRCIYLCRVGSTQCSVSLYMYMYISLKCTMHRCAYTCTYIHVRCMHVEGLTDCCTMLLFLLCSTVKVCVTCMARLGEIHHCHTEEKRYKMYMYMYIHIRCT